MASQHWGGAEKVFVEVSNFLAKDHEVIALVLRETEYLDRFSRDIKIVELKSHPTRHNPLLLIEIYKVVLKVGADIIHTHAVKASELVHSVNRYLNMPHVGTKHNARKGRIFNKMKWVTAVSQEAVDSVELKKGAEIRLIYNGIIPQSTETYPENERFSILAVGRLDKIKGFDVLITQLVEVSSEYRLTIVGTGKEFDNLQKHIDRLGFGGSVSLVGYSDDVPNLMKKSDLIVISSHSEGFPKVMIEALFYGNVLLSTPVGGVKEVLPALFLAEQNLLGHKINDIQQNYRSYFNSFTLLKNDVAESFVLEKIIRQYESFYMKMLS